ncbi:hypothetical protein CVD28_01220 [Bacillus sp. M6-12]|uniref:hypothetical protein n=1 Tax=Bacillus sp. M6-12 TaxID=2054166 RepID=UPI000C783244|nr:hypothetical protein [Bacillus sp. M6-12]PLS19054.1 hypothetical protein CVD28_01220 [Bacillus sp. M6-12]
MEYVLMAKVSYRQPGDYEDTIKRVDLGDIEIQSKEDIDHVCQKIAWDLNLKEDIHFNSFSEQYPSSSEFYLETKEELYGLNKMYKVRLIDCIRIKGRLFELKPFEI